MIQTNIEFDSNDEQDEDENIYTPKANTLEAQEHLQQLARYCSGIEELNTHVKTLKGAENRIYVYLYTLSRYVSDCPY